MIAWLIKTIVLTVIAGAIAYAPFWLLIWWLGRRRR